MTARAMSCAVDDVLFCIVCDARCAEPFCSERCRAVYERRWAK